jgi:hypothetical protein
MYYLAGYLISPNSVAFRSQACADEWELFAACNCRRHIRNIIGFVILEYAERTETDMYVQM